MNPIVKNILAVLAGVALGTVVNVLLVMTGVRIISPPDGVDPQNMQSIAEHLHLFSPKHFIFPFLGHALGTLAGAFAAVKLSTSKHISFGLGIGIWFLLGGVAAATMIPAPKWFVITDLLVAYLPMGWLGWKFGRNKK